MHDRSPVILHPAWSRRIDVATGRCHPDIVGMMMPTYGQGSGMSTEHDGLPVIRHSAHLRGVDVEVG
jgi:hypothetical protein